MAFKRYIRKPYLLFLYLKCLITNLAVIQSVQGTYFAFFAPFLFDLVYLLLAAYLGTIIRFLQTNTNLMCTWFLWHNIFSSCRYCEKAALEQFREVFL